MWSTLLKVAEWLGSLFGKHKPSSVVTVPLTPSAGAVSSKYPPDFERVFGFLMEWEGTAFENDPADPGGATKFGIDQRSHPDINIRALTLEQAKEIYYNEWRNELFPDLKRPLSEVYFNFCVNTGRGRANKLLQRALGVKDDGIIGDVTKKALESQKPSVVALSMIHEADVFYVALNKPRFIKGWLNRDQSLAAFSKSDGAIV